MWYHRAIFSLPFWITLSKFKIGTGSVSKLDEKSFLLLLSSMCSFQMGLQYLTWTGSGDRSHTDSFGQITQCISSDHQPHLHRDMNCKDELDLADPYPSSSLWIQSSKPIVLKSDNTTLTQIGWILHPPPFPRCFLLSQSMRLEGKSWDLIGGAQASPSVSLGNRLS